MMSILKRGALSQPLALFGWREAGDGRIDEATVGELG
jgi:hypothetical protein